jgi:hypothetical protein
LDKIHDHGTRIIKNEYTAFLLSCNLASHRITHLTCNLERKRLGERQVDITAVSGDGEGVGAKYDDRKNAWATSRLFLYGQDQCLSYAVRV